jgi:excisionase family DNA binding protein
VTRQITPDPNLLTIAEAATFAKISERTLYKWIRTDEKFTAAVVVKVGRRMRISKVRLGEWLHGRQVAS